MDVEDKMHIIDTIVSNQQCQKVRWKNNMGQSQSLILDTTTAQRIQQIYNNLNPENQTILLSWDWPTIAEFAWKQ